MGDNILLKKTWLDTEKDTNNRIKQTENITDKNNSGGVPRYLPRTGIEGNERYHKEK